MIKRVYGFIFIFLIAVALNGCDKAKQALGQNKEGPDEFAVFQRAPLSLPPDYNLRPPKPGSERPQALNPREKAMEAITARRNSQIEPVNNEKTFSGLSRGEIAILKLTGAEKADPSIRGKIREENKILAIKDIKFTDKIAFWQSPAKFGVVVNAPIEAKRIRERQALGKPLNAGDIPIIKRRRKALFENVFD